MRRGPSMPVSFTLLAALGLVVTIGCAAPSHRYVTDDPTQTYLPLPEGWSVFSGSELSPSQDPTNVFQTAGNPVEFQTMFTADPDATVADLQRFPFTSSPTGMVIVFSLTPSEQDAASILTLRNRLFPVDTWSQKDPNSVVLFERSPLSSQGFRGERIVFSRRGGSDPVHQYTDSVTVNQTVYLDPTGQRAYYLVVGCDSTCYDQQRSEIESIVMSWSVSP